MQAILTKYLGPTGFRGGRVKAQGNRHSVTLPWDHALNVAQNHRAAAEALARKMNWTPDRGKAFEMFWHEAAMPESSPWQYVYVLEGTVDNREGFYV